MYFQSSDRITQFTLSRFPLTQIFAYILISGGILHLVETIEQSRLRKFCIMQFFLETKMQVMWGIYLSWVSVLQGVPHQYGLHQYDFHQYEFYCHWYKISTSGGLVELLCSKISTSGNWLCSTHQYEFRIVRFFQNPKICTKRGPPVNSFS